MTLDWITSSVSEEDPAGPDLWETDDGAFGDYYFDAAGRLPEPDDYAKIGLGMGDGSKQPDTIFDPKSVDLAKETGEIDALLKRSRDLRLLTLRAQWAILAGEIDETTASVSAMADLIETMPNAVHPVIDGPPRDRLEAINDLAAVGAMILPLRYLDIGNTGTSLRRVMVARGKVTPHDGENDLALDNLLSALAKSRDSVTAAHGALTGLSDAITRIETACLSHDTPHTPQLGTLKQEIDAVLGLIGEAEPELAKPEDDAADTPEQSGAVASGAASKPVTEVKSHDEARRRLVAVETYFGRYEPSSAAVLLVTQSRLLIGKSLVDAFDILMPDTAPRAKVDFISNNGFQLAHGQLRQLANEVLIEELPELEIPEPPAPEPVPEPEPVPQEPAPQEDAVQDDTAQDDAAQDGDAEAQEPQTDAQDAGDAGPDEMAPVEEPPAPPPPEPAPEPAEEKPIRVADAGEAGSQILAVETYFRAVERSSPIPMLLARARTYIGKDFETLLKEFVPKYD